MNIWVVYAVGFSQMIVLFWLALPFCVWMTYDTYVNKNRQWVHEHPEFQQRYPAPRYAVWLSYLLGLAWLAVLVDQIPGSGSQFVPLRPIPPGIYRLFSGSLLSFVAVYSVHLVVEYFRMASRIPLPTKRAVKVERRSLQGILDPRWAYGGYLLIAAGAGIAGIAYWLGGISVGALALEMRALGALALVALLSSLGLAYSVTRKKLPLDVTFGPSYRKSELIVWISLLYLAGIVGILRLYDILFGTHLLSPLPIMLGISVLVQFGMFYAGRHPWLRWLFPRNPGAPHSTVTLFARFRG
jgi:hypothetical protein